MKYLHSLASRTPSYVTPNHLSWFRIWMVPVLWITYVVFGPLLTFFLYAITCLSDWLDGHLARTRGLITQSGKRLDEVSDKILAAGVLTLLFASNIILLEADSFLFWCSIIIVVRELAVTTIRGFWPERASRIPSLLSAKWKTTIMMMGFGLLMLGGIPHPMWQALAYIGAVFVAVATILAIWSGAWYGWLFLKAGK